MRYKFDYITLTDPKFTFSEGNVVGEFVTVWVNVGGMFDWILGAMPIGEDMQTWGEIQLKQYEVQ
jgi:hypothetical protein